MDIKKEIEKNKSVEQRFNEKLIEFFKNTPVSVANINNVPHYLIGSEDKAAQAEFYVRPEILRITSADFNIFRNMIPTGQDVFNADFKRKMKIGFSKTSTIFLINEIAKTKDEELKEYLVKNLTKMNNKISLLWWADRLSDAGLNIVLKAKPNSEETKKSYRVNCLEQRFFKYFINRLNKNKEDCSEELKEFLIPYVKDFQKKDYAATIMSFVEDKYPQKLDEYIKFLKLKTENKELISISTDLISIKLNKDELYKIIKDKGVVDKNVYWHTLENVEKFITKEKKKLGINYCLLSGYNNSTDSFNLIVEVNEKFKMNPEMLSKIIPEIFELYFDHKGKLSDLEIKNANSIINYHILNKDLLLEESKKQNNIYKV